MMKTFKTYAHLVRRVTIIAALLILALTSSDAQSYSWHLNWGDAQDEEIRATAADASGNIYIAGHFRGNTDFDPGVGTNSIFAGTADAFIAKYDANRNFLWAFKLGDTQFDIAYDLELDASGNVYVCGRMGGLIDFDPGPGTANITANSNSSFVAKYDTNGNYVWAFKLNSQSGSSFFIETYGLALANNGDVVVTGAFNCNVDFDPAVATAFTNNSYGLTDIFVAKYNAAGQYLSTYTIGGSSYDYSKDVQVDASGNIYIIGHTEGTADFDPSAGSSTYASQGFSDAFIAKYASAGALTWVKNFGGTGIDEGEKIHLDQYGNIYGTGFFRNTTDFDPTAGTNNIASNGNSDVYFTKFQTDGTYEWTIGTGSSSNDQGRSITSDADGNVIFGGSLSPGTVDFDPTGGTMNAYGGGGYIAYYSPAGSPLWAYGLQFINSSSVYDLEYLGGKDFYLAGGIRMLGDLDPGTGYVPATTNGGTDMLLISYSTCAQNTTSLTTSICDGESYVLGTQTLTATGSYSEVFALANGCDSVVNLNLTVLPANTNTVSDNACAGTSYSFGTQTLTSSGTYNEVFTAANGCDSTVTLNLTFYAPNTNSISESICFGTSYTLGTQTLTSTGTYNEVFTGTNGCDSTVTLSLIVLPQNTASVSTSICFGTSFTFGTQTLTTTGTYNEIFTDGAGCDSTVTLALTVLPNNTSNQVASICSGDSYTFGTQTLTTAGSYNEVFTAVNGCDSTVTLALTVLPISSNTLSETICAGASYILGTQTLNMTGTYNAVFMAANGCDSTVTLNLTVLPVNSTTTTASICDGETFVLGTQNLTTTGTYIEIFTASNGCDSTVTLTLTVNPTQTQSASLSICSGDSVLLGGAYQSTSGTYVDSLVNSDGCDSVVTTTLSVNSTIQTAQSHDICDGDSIFIGGDWQLLSGAYVDTFQSGSSCDSLITHTLTVHLAPTANIGPDTLWVCDGEELSFGIDTSGITTYSISNFFTTAFDDSLTFVYNALNPPSSVVSSATSIYGCTGSDQVILVNNELVNTSQTFPTMNDPFVTFDIAFMPTNADFWYWSFGDSDTLSGVQSPTYEYTANGSYQACLIAINECGRDSSCVTFDITAVGIEQYNAWQQVSIYPNPSNGIYTIDGLESGTTIKVISATGQTTLENQTTSNSIQIDLTSQSRGLYFIQLTNTETGVKPGVFRVTKN